MNFKFVLIDLTTDATPDSMKPAQIFARMVEAISVDLLNDFANEWGFIDFGFRVGNGPADRSTDEIAINFRDTIPETPGALAYHTELGGTPDIEIGVDLFTDLDGPDGLVKAVDHEIKETILSPGANEWASLEDGSGRARAKEACDLVQNLSRQKENGAHVSAFVLQAAFIPGSSGPWDSENAMSNQNDMSNGYSVDVADVGTPVMSGRLNELQAKRKNHPYSRAARLYLNARKG